MKNKKIFFICILIFVFFLKLNNVCAVENYDSSFLDDFISEIPFLNNFNLNARFFAGSYGYLENDNYRSSEFDTKQGVRIISNVNEIDSDHFKNYYKRINATFAGWIASKDEKQWLCSDGKWNEGPCNSYLMFYVNYGDKDKRLKDNILNFCSNSEAVDFHAVWKDNDTQEIIYPKYAGKSYSYSDVLFVDEYGRTLATQPMILGDHNNLMHYSTLGDTGYWYLRADDSFSKHYWVCDNGTFASEASACSIRDGASNRKDGRIQFNSDSSINFDILNINAKDKGIKRFIFEANGIDVKYMIRYISTTETGIETKAEFYNFDESITLNSDIFSKPGDEIVGWKLYTKKNVCYKKQDGNFSFNQANCKTVVSPWESIIIPYDSDFRRYELSNSFGTYGLDTAFFVLNAEAVWKYSGVEVEDEEACIRQKKIWTSTGTDSGYCSVDGLTYLKCGDIKDFPAIIPKLSSYAVSLLKTVAPIVLIIASIISLAKSMTAGKEDEIKKAQSILVKRIIIFALIFFTITIVQFLVLRVADESEQGNLSNCLSCFLNGTSNKNCSNIYYKDKGSNGFICKWVNNNESFVCDSN